MAEISVAEVDQAEAALADAKATYNASEKTEEDAAAFRAAKRQTVELRQAWRLQEEAAGRRTGKVGGDAVAEEG